MGPVRLQPLRQGCRQLLCGSQSRLLQLLRRGKLGEQPRDVHRALIERRVQIAHTVVVV